MSKQANPLAIGTFLVGALTLLVVALMVFGGGQFSRKRFRFVIFRFGLERFERRRAGQIAGVQIGNVNEISLVMDEATGRVFKPVVIEIDPALLRDVSGQQGGAHTEKQHRQAAQN